MSVANSELVETWMTASSGWVNLTDNVLIGGGISIKGGGITATRNVFCAMAEPIYSIATGGGPVFGTLKNNWFIGNDRLPEHTFGGPGGNIDYVNNTFMGSGGALSCYWSSASASPPHIEVRNSIFGNVSNVDCAVTLEYNAPHAGSGIGPWADYPGDCSIYAFVPPHDSWLIDAGDPSILDRDGTRSDIGATGGPDALVTPDGDGDGYPEAWDCDDGDASSHPGAEEVPEDGIDQDCSGADAQPDSDAPDSDVPEPEGRAGGGNGLRCDNVGSLAWSGALLAFAAAMRRRRR